MSTKYIVHMVIELEDEQDTTWVKDVVKETMLEAVESMKTVTKVQVFAIAK